MDLSLLYVSVIVFLSSRLPSDTHAHRMLHRGHHKPLLGKPCTNLNTFFHSALKINEFNSIYIYIYTVFLTFLHQYTGDILCLYPLKLLLQSFEAVVQV